MTNREFFEHCKNKRLRQAFALVQDGDSVEIERWYLDFSAPARPVRAVWKEDGELSVSLQDIESYAKAWAEYCRRVEDARANAYQWSLYRKSATEHLSEACSKAQSKFWTSVIESLDFMQIDTRMC